MLLGFGAENQLETFFFLASISCAFCALDFSIETLLNWNRGRTSWVFIDPADRTCLVKLGRPPSGITRP
jgi:hypothetical protein